MLPVILAIVGAGGAFLLAGAAQNRGWYLADQLCLQGAVLCDRPGLIFIAISAVAVIVTIRAVIKA